MGIGKVSISTVFLDSQVNISQQIPLGIKFNKPKNKWPFIFFSQ
jgi:hypothetical protein